MHVTKSNPTGSFLNTIGWYPLCINDIVLYVNDVAIVLKRQGNFCIVVVLVSCGKMYCALHCFK